MLIKKEYTKQAQLPTAAIHRRLLVPIWRAEIERPFSQLS